jgi:uncharacterized protein YqjF (DUF2071 family)
MFSTRPFIRAEWRNLVFLNFEIDPQILTPYVPQGTQLDTWEGRTYVSVVGFLFMNTRVLGVPLPFHQSFEEVNLRFYVRRDCPNECRRGVVFIREIAPRRTIALAARILYNENYLRLPMTHRIKHQNDRIESVTYNWRYEDRDCSLHLETASQTMELQVGSFDEFITEHFWGYAVQRNGRTLEYHVEHPRWRIAPASRASIDSEILTLYGPPFVQALSKPPASAAFADGSEVAIHRGTLVK